MALNYLTDGDRATADKINDIFSKADDVLNACFVGKTPLFWTNLSSSFPHLWLNSRTIPGSPFWKNQDACNGLFGIPFFYCLDSADAIVTSSNPPCLFNSVAGDGNALSMSIQYYDHNITKEKANKIVSDTISEDKKFIVAPNIETTSYYTYAGAFTPYDYSLEAFKLDLVKSGSYFITASTVNSGSVYYIADDIRQDTIQYGQAEIIVQGMTSLNVPDNYDKYNFFRFHNLSNNTCSISFGSHKSFTLPAHGIQCIRRDNGVYTDGYRYFQKALSGDPRFYAFDRVDENHSLDEIGIGDNQAWFPCSPIGSIGSNNAISIAVILKWLQWLERRSRLLYDESTHSPAKSYYNVFGGVDSLGQVLDGKLSSLLVTMSGSLNLVTASNGSGSTISYTDFDDLNSQVAALGVSVTSSSLNGNKTWTKSGYDIICHNTTLLDDKQVGIVSLTSGITIGDTFTSAFTSDCPVVRFTSSIANLSSSYYVDAGGYIGSTQYKAKPERVINKVTTVGSPVSQSTLNSTVADLKTLNSFGKGNHNSDWSDYSNVSASFSGHGLAVTYKQNVLLNQGRYNNTILEGFHTTYQHLLTPDEWNMSGSNLFRSKRIEMGKHYGWPSINSGSVDKTMFLSPRRDRFTISGSMNSTYLDDKQYNSPSILNSYVGRDLTLAVTSGSKLSFTPSIQQPQAIRNLRPVKLEWNTIDDTAYAPYNLTCTFRQFEYPDSLGIWLAHQDNPAWYVTNRTALISGSYEAGKVGERYPVLVPSLLAEHYNNIAEWLLKIVKVKPYDYRDKLTLNGTFDGICGSGYKPINQFCAFSSSDTGRINQFTSLGIPIYDSSSFHSSFYDVVNSASLHTIDVVLNGTVTSWNSSTKYYNCSLDSYDIQKTVADTENARLDNVFGNHLPDYRGYKWIKIEDVKSYCDSVNLPFVYFDTVVPVDIKQSEYALTFDNSFKYYLPDATQIIPDGNTVTRQIRYRYNRWDQLDTYKTPFRTKIYRFSEDANGNWAKATPLNPRIMNWQAADTNAGINYDVGHVFSGEFNTSFIIYRTDFNIFNNEGTVDAITGSSLSAYPYGGSEIIRLTSSLNYTSDTGFESDYYAWPGGLYDIPKGNGTMPSQSLWGLPDTNTLACRGLLFRCYGNQESKYIGQPVSRMDYGTGYGSISPDKLKSRFTIGAGVISGSYVETGSAFYGTISGSQYSSSLITPDNDSNAWDVAFICDNWMSL